MNWRPINLFVHTCVEDYGDFWHTRDVMVSDGTVAYHAYMQAWVDNEYDPEWRMVGRDGDNVSITPTHYCEITLPKKEIRQC